MLKNENIICISSIDWDFIWQGHQEIMSAFAKNGNKVLFIENTGARAPRLSDIQRLKKRLVNWFRSTKGFREEAPNLYVYSPLILPFPYSRIARYINRHILINPIRRWMEMAEFHKPIIWTFLPTWIALDIINNINRKLLIYYCIADFYELVDNPKKVTKTENELIKKSDLIFAQGSVLKAKCESLNRNVYIFPFGVNMEAFENLKSTQGDTPDDMRGVRHPIIGYVGGIHRHIDFELLKYIARSHPEWSIVLIGPIQTDVCGISDLPNVSLLGKKDFSSLSIYIRQFDACIIPYAVNRYTETVFPTKLNEYHALGKPVVSTRLPEVVSFNKENDDLVSIGHTYPEFVGHISKSLAHRDGELEAKRIDAAKNNSWAVRIERMSDLIEDSILKKSSNAANWRENLIKFYMASRKKAIISIGVFLSGYALIFHTPLIWFMAEPLKISEEPENADCIIVFGGGVGESGKAAQGYEERAGYAVELYKKGYAKHLIFSSGFQYVFEETLVMKALAVALGVPKEAIIIENNAGNTYENVKFTKAILNKERWDKVLLVSSPYHMRRVHLVFNKIAKEIKVIYTPIPKSSFYSHASKGIFVRAISPHQIGGILHEWLGVIYYHYKGWI